MRSVQIWIGAAVWRGLLAEHPIARAPVSPRMMLPLLTKLSIEVGPEPVTLAAPVTADGGFELARTVDAAGDTERVIANMWASLSGTRGRIYAPISPDAPIVTIGRVFAEHVFTRPFAPAAERKAQV